MITKGEHYIPSHSSHTTLTSLFGCTYYSRKGRGDCNNRGSIVPFTFLQVCSSGRLQFKKEGRKDDNKGRDITSSRTSPTIIPRGACDSKKGERRHKKQRKYQQHPLTFPSRMLLLYMTRKRNKRQDNANTQQREEKQKREHHASSCTLNHVCYCSAWRGRDTRQGKHADTGSKT